MVEGAALQADVGVTVSAAKTSLVPNEAVEIRVAVGNKEIAAATGLRALITLPPDATLLGPPAFERGSGCTGTSTLDCSLDYLPANSSTLLRFSIAVGAVGVKAIGARVSANGGDRNEQDNSGSVTLQVTAPPTTAVATPAKQAGSKGVTRIGTNGPNVLVGTARADLLNGRGGNDRLLGRSGDDRLLGGAGRDVLDGGAGNDTIAAADRAKDTIRCGSGRDVVVADRIDAVARDCERVRRRR